MKHGKKPTVRQAEMITAAGHDHRMWLVVKDMPHSMVIVNRDNGVIEVIDK